VIDFRYHLVSIVAVFLALAIGIVVGASAIKPEVLNVFDHASNSELHQIASQRTTIRNQQTQLGTSETFAQSAAPVLLDGLLAGQQVALVTAPGADGATISGITTALEQAGAKVTTQVQLQSAFFDTSAATQSSLEALAKQVAPPTLTLQTAPPGTRAPTTGQLEAAQVLAAALVTKDGLDLPADETDPIIKGFTQQGFLQLSPASASAPAQATLAVVVIPASPPATDADPANLALVSVADQLSLSSRGVVVAGSLNGSGPGSAIDELINGNTGVQLSSVNNADKEIGQIFVAQVLSSLLSGHSKAQAYGVGAAVPTPAPTPSPTSSPASTAAASKHPSRA
jgi:hypothetical protein